jgi:homoserine kinase
VFGLALDAFYDEVTVTKKPKSFGIKIVSSDDIPLDPKKNTVGIAAKNMMENSNCTIRGLEISIKKGVPAGYGLGSSAASAAACIVAMNVLDGGGWEREYLVHYAGQGEKASAGTVHYDNVAAAVLGGFVVVQDNSIRHGEIEALELARYNTSDELKVVLAIPKIKIPKMKTKVSRGVLPKTVKFTDAMKDLRNAASIVARLAVADKKIKVGDKYYPTESELIYAMAEIHDESISERARKKLIPGYDKVKKLGKAAGADAVTISGAGPTVIALVELENDVIAKEVGEEMKKGFKSAKVDCDIVICKPSKGPKIVKVVK